LTTHDFSNQGLIIVVAVTELNLQNGLIEFRREQDICSGINRATLTVTSELVTIPEIYSKIYVYEGDYEGETFVGDTFIFYVASIERIQGSTVSITCQDITKLLADYLVEDDYTIEENMEWVIDQLKAKNNASHIVAYEKIQIESRKKQSINI